MFIPTIKFRQLLVFHLRKQLDPQTLTVTNRGRSLFTNIESSFAQDFSRRSNCLRGLFSHRRDSVIDVKSDAHRSQLIQVNSLSAGLRDDLEQQGEIRNAPGHWPNARAQR